MKKKKIRQQNILRRKKIRNFFAVLFLIGGLLFGNIYIRTELNDINNKIEKANEEIIKLESVETSLQMEFESLYSYKSLWKKAESLGMKPKSESQVHYISTNNEAYAEVINSDTPPAK